MCVLPFGYSSSALATIMCLSVSGCCSFLTSSFSHSLALLSLFLMDFVIDENVLFYTLVSMVTLHRAKADLIGLEMASEVQGGRGH